MESLTDVVVKDPAVMGGEPVFRGTRVPVKSFIDRDMLRAAVVEGVAVVDLGG